MNCKCGEDLTSVAVRNGTSKTGKPWSAKFCPKCKEANWIKSFPRVEQKPSVSTPTPVPTTVVDALARIEKKVDQILQHYWDGEEQ